MTRKNRLDEKMAEVASKAATEAEAVEEAKAATETEAGEVAEQAADETADETVGEEEGATGTTDGDAGEEIPADADEVIDEAGTDDGGDAMSDLDEPSDVDDGNGAARVAESVAHPSDGDVPHVDASTDVIDFGFEPIIPGDNDPVLLAPGSPNEPQVYMPVGRSYSSPRKAVRARRQSSGDGHTPWLVGGLAAGMLIAALGAGMLSMVSNRSSAGDSAGRAVETASASFGVAPSGQPAESNRGEVADTPLLARNVAAKCLPSVVAVHVSDGMGSGVVIDGDGHVITNSHVVKDQKEILVVNGAGEEFKASVLGLDDSSDLAVLDVEWGDAEHTAIEWGDSSSLVVGDWVMTIGSPYGLDQSASTGIVSALARNQMMESYGGYRIYANLIQTDAAINVGNSGGALVDAEGKLVGINSMLASSSGSYSAVGFAIPSNYAKRVADQIVAGNEVEHAYIGAQFGSVSPFSTGQQGQQSAPVVDEAGNEVDASGGTPKTGAYVAKVLDDSPAKAAGLQEGDIITKFGDERISSASGVIMAVRAHEIGEEVPVEVWRDGKTVELKVTLGTDKGKGLYDNDGSDRQQQSPYGYSPYGGGQGIDSWEYLEQLFEQMGLGGR